MGMKASLIFQMIMIFTQMTGSSTTNLMSLINTLTDQRAISTDIIIYTLSSPVTT